MNSGSDAGTSVYTSTSGNWNGTSTFTPTDGSNPATASPGVTVGQFANVYNDGATTPVYVARVTSVTNAVNGAIGLSTTAKAGTAPTSNATQRSIKVGGCWKGPNAADAWPFTISGTTLQNATNTSGDPVRVNLKNNSTYNVTANIAATAFGNTIFQGYSSSTGDGGRANIDGGTTNATILTLGQGNIIADLIISTNATGTSIHGIAMATGTIAYRCVVHDVRGSGISVSGTAPCIIQECEVYNFNKSNTSGLAGINLQGNGFAVLNNYIHDGTAGTNCHGIRTSAGTNTQLIEGNIIDTCSGSGISVASSDANTQAYHSISNNNFYNNGYGIRIEATAGNYYLIVQNNNFIKNTTAAFEGGTTFTRLFGYFFNNGYGSGTQANGSDYLHSGSLILDDGTGNSSRVVYASNLTPWVAPTTGDFRINLGSANFAGRQAFTETDGTNTGTVGYPDIGAAQSLTGPNGTFSKEHSYGFA